MGIFTNCMLMGTALVLSSGVFAGIRRATGLTFKRSSWPPFDCETSQKWLSWYHTRLAQLNERAEQRVQSAISRYSAEIPDPNIRRVWEEQLRADVREKVRRIEDRIKYFQHIVDRKEKRHPWGLALYLKMGEWLVDWMVGRMRESRHFVVDPLVDHADHDLDIWQDHLVASSHNPLPFIAQPSTQSSQPQPQPSAPPLPETDKLPPQASTSKSHNEPPPYTLIDEEDKSI